MSAVQTNANTHLNIGAEYIGKVDRLRELMGAKTMAGAVRTVVDAILFEADQKGLSEVAPQLIGIKPIKKAPKKKAVKMA